MDSEKQYWFRLRANGIGWTPASWKGWFIIVVWILMVLATMKYSFMDVFSSGSGFLSFLKLLLGWSVLFLIVVWKKSEPLPLFSHKNDTRESDE